ncbi:histone H2A, putative [Leishmania donovani]|uniref:Histone H2A, putative n=2 Tax=Leishmania donovani species complex TaxID=38574 RepID=E9BKY2_LEIDO|nr:histone H2A, putative [Leishmania donovani]CBZ35910.1 histone H2A, putative [Leishmania donovani]
MVVCSIFFLLFLSVLPLPPLSRRLAETASMANAPNQTHAHTSFSAPLHSAALTDLLVFCFSLPLPPLQPTHRSHGYSSQRQEGRPQERLQVREMWSDLPGGPRRRDDAPRPVRSPHRCLWRRVPGCRAGVPDCGAAGAVREGGRAEREEAVPPEPAHRDAGCAPRRRHRHASEERDLVSQRRCAEHQQGDGKEEGRQEGQGDTERLDHTYPSLSLADRGQGVCALLCGSERCTGLRACTT